MRELLLDLVHLHVELGSTGSPFGRRRGGERTTQVAGRVQAARDRQSERYGCSLLNAHLRTPDLLDVCQLNSPGQSLLDTAIDRMQFTARRISAVVQIARTIADLAGSVVVTPPHLAEAIQYQARNDA